MTTSKPSVAKDVFVYLLVFVMLYIGVVHFIGLLWQIIEVQFPDATQTLWQSPYENMRVAIASLIVVWPVFLLTSRYIARDLSKHPEKVNLWVRKWLTYLTLFVASITIIVDLIVLINYFLGGELTTRFMLKVVAILLVAGAAFWYEFWELKRKPNEGKKQLATMASVSAVVVIAGIIAGFFFVGTPGSAREQRLDSERVLDLENIQSQVVSYWNQKDALPESLSDLDDSVTGFEVPVDPETEAAYEYSVTSDLTFELCATFAQETPEWAREAKTNPRIIGEFARVDNGNWVHEAGRDCFERTIDPELHGAQKVVQ